ncbi:MAG: P-loop NTPase, partial [Pyrinomonadaceae bacterium]
MSQVTQEKVLETLRQIIDPDLRKDIVSLGFVRDLKVEDGEVSFRIVLTTPACPVKDEMAKQAKQLVSEIEGVKSVNVTMDAEVPKGRGMSNSDIENIKNIIAVSSGKGGVGKSTVAVNLAVSLALDGAKVGLMDADIYGPNVPIMLGVKNFKPYISDRKLVPVEAHGVKMISM